MERSGPKYPKVKVKLIGRDGNAFTIIGVIRSEMRKHKIPKEEIDLFLKEAMAGDYNHLLMTCMEWVTVK